MQKRRWWLGLAGLLLALWGAVGGAMGAGALRSTENQVLYLSKSSRVDVDTARIVWHDLAVGLGFPVTDQSDVISYAVAPSGTEVIYISRTSNDAHGFFRVDLHTRDTQFLMNDPTDAITPVWSPAGDELVYDNFSSRSLYRLNLVTMRSERLFGYDGVTLAMPDWSPDGETLVLTAPRTTGNDRQPDLMLYYLEDERRQWLTSNRVPEAHPRFSPDGNRILYRVVESSEHRLMIYDLRDDTTQQVYEARTDLWGADWSNDGQQIAFQVIQGGGSQLMVMNLETGATRVITPADGWYSNPVWLP